jgi:uncharacterized protein involved in exopolysaccharide biosynthesis
VKARDAGVPENEEISLLAILAALVRERRTIIVVTAIAILASLAYALTRPAVYASLFSFVPQGAPDANRAGLASLAGQLGVSIGGAASGGQSPQFYADLLHTKAILVPIVTDTFTTVPGQSMQLTEYLKASGPPEAIRVEKAIKSMRRKVVTFAVAARTTGVVTVNVRTLSPEVSLAIADRLLRALNDFNLSARQSQAGEERRFIERRLAVARTTLKEAEDSLAQHLRTNRQIGTSPELTFLRDRLQTAVTLQRSSIATLAQSLEEARIREVRDTPVITVVERPMLAALPDSRGRVMIMIGGTLAGVLAGAVAALLADRLRRMRESDDPDLEPLRQAWRGLRRAKQ